MIDRGYGVPDFPINSDGFDDPKSPRTFSTELENTDTFSVQNIFDLGFLRSNPERKIYQHKDKPDLYLEEIYKVDYSIRDKVVRFIEVYTMKYQSWGGSWTQTVLYTTTKPSIDDIQKIIDNY